MDSPSPVVTILDTLSDFREALDRCASKLRAERLRDSDPYVRDHPSAEEEHATALLERTAPKPTTDCRYCGEEGAVSLNLDMQLWYCFGCSRGGYLNDVNEPGAALVGPRRRLVR